MPAPRRSSHTNLLSALRTTARQVGPTRPALTDAGGTLSFASAIDQSIVLADRLAALSPELEASETIASYQLSGPHTLQFLVAAAIAGRTLAFLNPAASRRTLLRMCQTARVRRIVCPKDLVGRIARILHDEAFEPLGISILVAEDLLAPGGFLARARARWRARRTPRARSQALAVLFSENESGRLRGVQFSERNLLAASRQAIHRRLWSNEDVSLCAQPLHQYAALVLGLLAPVLAGAHTVIVGRPSAYHGVIGAARELRATVLVAAPAYLNHYARAARAEDFAMLTRVLVIGEPLAAETGALVCERFGVTVHEAFIDPIAGLVAISPGDMEVGGGPMRLARGTKVKLIATRERIRRGALHVRGPQVARATIDEGAPGVAAAVDSPIGPEWRATGEVFDVLPHRFVRWIPGRGAFIHLAGETIALARAENLARGASPERTHAAVASTDGTRQYVVLFTTDPKLVRRDLTELADALGEPRVIVPRLVVQMRTLPTDARGGIDYELLRRNTSGPPEHIADAAHAAAEHEHQTVAQINVHPANAVALPARLEGIFTAINRAFAREVTGHG